MRRPQAGDIKVDMSVDFPEEELFPINCDGFGITRKDWICGTSFNGRIQMIGVFEILNLDDCGVLEEGDNFEYPYCIQTSLMVHPKFYGQGYLKNIMNNDDLLKENNGKYPLHYALGDAYSYGGGIPVRMDDVSSSHKSDVEFIIEDVSFGFTCRRFKTYNDAEKYINDVYVHNIGAIMGLIGFTLDCPVNMIGTTGWDIVRNMTEDIDQFKAALNRFKDE